MLDFDFLEIYIVAPRKKVHNFFDKQIWLISIIFCSPNIILHFIKEYNPNYNLVKDVSTNIHFIHGIILLYKIRNIFEKRFKIFNKICFLYRKISYTAPFDV